MTVDCSLEDERILFFFVCFVFFFFPFFFFFGKLKNPAALEQRQEDGVANLSSHVETHLTNQQSSVTQRKGRCRQLKHVCPLLLAQELFCPPE